MTLYSRTAAILLCLAVAAVLVAVAVLKHCAYVWFADAAEPKPPRREAPGPLARLEGTLEDDIWGKDLDIPAVVAPFVDYTHYPYRATDFFSDLKVAELAEAARDGNVQRIDALVAAGVDVNARGNLPKGETKDTPLPGLWVKGLTPLMYAMSGKTLKGFERLLERGADPNVQTYGCESAVTFAAQRKDSEALKLLLAHGGNANLFRRSPAGRTDEITPTPIYLAAMLNRSENARLLIKAGADVNARSIWGRTPLLFAEGFSSFDVVYVLLEAGADFRIKDEDGWLLTYHIVDEDECGGKDTEAYIKGVASRQKCIDWLGKHGVDWAKERAKFAEFLRRNEDDRRKPKSEDTRRTF